MKNKLRKRATAVILEDGKVLLIRRVKAGKEYFVFPGGGIEKGETIKEALIREVKEELCLVVKKFKPIFSIENIEMPPRNQNEYFFQIEEYEGTPKIGGPEKERMNDQNQYHIVWVNIKNLEKEDNIYPKEGVLQLLETLSSQ